MRAINGCSSVLVHDANHNAQTTFCIPVPDFLHAATRMELLLDRNRTTEGTTTGNIPERKGER